MTLTMYSNKQWRRHGVDWVPLLLEVAPEIDKIRLVFTGG